MKKFLWTMVSVLLILTAFCLIASAEDVYRGDELSFTIHVDTYEGIKSGSVEFLYNADQFEVVEGAWSLSPNPFVSDFKTQDGKGVFLYASPVTLGGDVFHVKFRVKDTAAFEESELAVKIRVLNASGESQWIEYSLGTYQILCQHSFTQQVANDAYLFSQATCTDSAVYYVSCSCGEMGTETFVYGEPLGHRYDHNCDVSCNACGAIREVSHAYTDEYSKDAAGHWQVCASCGHESEHAPHERPCDSVCRVCGIEKTASHSYEAVVTPPTCTEDGYTTHTCTACGDSYRDATVGATGHTPGAAADCLNDQVCTVCGAVVTPKSGHDYESAVTPPTCTEDGYTTHTCTACGDSYRDATVGATGHTPGAAADCLNDQVCTVCGAVVTSKLGHDEVNHEAKAPTCTDMGWNAYVTCSRCAHTTYTEIPAEGHAYGEWTQTTAPGCETDGEEQRDCEKCDHSESRVIESAGHRDDDGDGVCDACGVGSSNDTDDSTGSDTEKPDDPKPEDTTVGDTEEPDETSPEDTAGSDTEKPGENQLSLNSPVVKIAICVLGAILVIGVICLIIRKLRYL